MTLAQRIWLGSLKILLLLVTLVYGLAVLLLSLFALSDSESSLAGILLRIAIFFVPSPLIAVAWWGLRRVSRRAEAQDGEEQRKEPTIAAP